MGKMSQNVMQCMAFTSFCPLKAHRVFFVGGPRGGEGGGGIIVLEDIALQLRYRSQTGRLFQCLVQAPMAEKCACNVFFCTIWQESVKQRIENRGQQTNGFITPDISVE